MKQLIEAGKVRPVVDRAYPLSETAAAMRRVEEATSGTVVITVWDTSRRASTRSGAGERARSVARGGV